MVNVEYYHRLIDFNDKKKDSLPPKNNVVQLREKQKLTQSPQSLLHRDSQRELLTTD